jgi:hypothetical protein
VITASADERLGGWFGDIERIMGMAERMVADAVKITESHKM